MNNPEFTKKDLKDLRGELFADKSLSFWNFKEEKNAFLEDKINESEQNSIISNDNELIDEEEMSMWFSSFLTLFFGKIDHYRTEAVLCRLILIFQDVN